MSRSHTVRWAAHVVVAAAWLLVAQVSWAQVPTGVIEGVVRDQSGQVVPGVTVTVDGAALIQKNLAVVSNQEGYYGLPLLPPGTYTVTFQLDGFQTLRRSGLVLTAGQTLTVPVELSLAGVNEAVVVDGRSPTLDYTSAKVSFAYSDALIKSVPTGRDFHALMKTAPGVGSGSAGGAPATPGTTLFFNVLGAGAKANAFTFDGTSATDPGVGNDLTRGFSYDIVEEVQIMTAAKPAEVGFARGGYFQIVTKSGGNSLHGETSGYFQDDALQSNNVTAALRQRGLTSTTNRLLESGDASASLGGRIVRDRIWWYGSARRQTQTLELLGYPENLADRTNAYFWKNTVQASAAHRFTGSVNRWSQSTTPSFFGLTPAVSGDTNASFIRDTGGNLASFRWNGILSPAVIVDGGWGYANQRLNNLFQPSVGIALRDLVTDIRYRNPGTAQKIAPSNTQDANGSISLFVPNAAGRHRLKAGVQYTRGEVRNVTRNVEDQRLWTSGGAPERVTLVNTPAESLEAFSTASGYVQDDWTIRERLTLNLGVRFDRVHAGLGDSVYGGGVWANTSLADAYPDFQRHTTQARTLFTWNNAAPRLSAAWVLAERTVARGSYSRYYHRLADNEIPGTGTTSVTELTFQWTDPNRDGVFQLGEQGRLLTTVAGATQPVDPDIQSPYTDEAVVGVSRELPGSLSLTANYIWRRDALLTDTYDAGVPFSAFRPVSTADPGRDGIAGTADDSSLTVYAQDPATLGANQRIFANIPGNTRRYRALELVGTKLLSDRWQFVGSLIVSRNIVTQTDFTTPNGLVNASGRDSLTNPVEVKLQATYNAPYGFIVSSFTRLASGFPMTRQLVVRGLPQGTITVNAEPRGTSQTERITNVDLRVEKAVPLGENRRLGFIADVFNLTNASTVLVEGTRTGVNLGVPQTVANPRLARLGVRFLW